LNFIQRAFLARSREKGQGSCIQGNSTLLVNEPFRFGFLAR
jgi:hypothetical protein